MNNTIAYYRAGHRISACAPGEPSMTLVRNDGHFDLLIAGNAHEDPFATRLTLEHVTHLCIGGRQWSTAAFDSVAVFRQWEVWLARDAASGRYFPNPSRRPYCVVFLTPAEFQHIRYAQAEGLPYPVFQIAQKHFGRLPGFCAQGRSLESPGDYATSPETFSPSRYVQHSRIPV